MALVRVMHDYFPDGSDGGRSKPIKQGQIFELAAKTNDDWWLVIDSKTSHQFFVPRNYVEPLQKTPLSITTEPLALKKRPPDVAPRLNKLTPEEQAVKYFDDALADELDDNENAASEEQYAMVVKKDTKEKLGTNSNIPGKIESPVKAHDNWSNAIAKVVNKAEEDKLISDSSLNQGKPATKKTLPRTDIADINKPVKMSSFKNDNNSYSQNNKNPSSSDLPAKPAKLDSRKSLKLPMPSPTKEEADPLNSQVKLLDEVRILRSSSQEDGEILYENTLSQKEVGEEPLPDYANLEELQQVIFKHMPEPRPVSISRASDALPDGWEIHVDSSGRPFYMHKVTKKTSWTLPSVDKLNQNRKTVCLTNNISVEPGFVNPFKQGLNLNWNNKDGAMETKAESSSRKSRDDSIFNKEPNVPVGLDSALVPPSPQGTKSLERQGKPLEGNLKNNMGETTPNGKSQPVQLKEWAESLNRTKVVENGKKCRKNWGLSFLHLNGRYLHFYKHPGPPKPSQKPEGTIDLHNAEIRSDVEQMSSKKNVLLVKKEGTEYLLTSDSVESIIVWAKMLNENIEILKTLSADALQSLEEVSSKSKSLKKHTSSVSSLENLEEMNQRKRVETLNTFLPKRKSIKDLKDKNIYKYASVFGNHLQQLTDREKTLVPKFVSNCISAIEKKGLATTGLYRISGNLADVQSLRFIINKEEKYDQLATKWDVHVLTGALKMFFRELQEPLFTFSLFDAFLKTMEEKDDKVRAKQEKELIDRLPATNKETIKTLFRHMTNVVAHKAENQMSNHSIAVVFGPTLLWPESSTSLELGTLLVCQGRVVENILTDIGAIF